MRINKKQMRQWIRALRSGKYSQSEGDLQNTKGYCCLGVACKVLIPENKQIKDKKNRLEGALPAGQPFAPDWLKAINTDVKDQTGRSLSFQNDGKYMSFQQIADLLEKLYLSNGVTNYEKL